ncbi:flagellar hook-associated protein FlgK [Planococcus lenghuensis]|uniref:Flagellar hook-associated protein 1 n=1 Tax=Planococcus lenghuensis TaxID=2213202 RepID=A0A1Q2L105_9BACL|nr:flagellar hook-associated protein FlgK [Planococcus lenghuensis]AQQ54140.1 flagellar hook-associated protein FlgK [Planococcus lenghuensis]
MVSTFHGLELGKRGLMASQANIATTGHNIANAGTKGYSRQQVNTVTSPPLDVWTNGDANPSQLGSGVLVESITRVRDRFLDQQYRDSAGTLAKWQTQQTALSRIETVVNEPSDTGLNSAMDAVWSAQQDLALNPDSQPARAVVKERAQAFVETAQAMDRSLSSLKTDLQSQTVATVQEANDYLKQIAALNDSIRRTGKNANDLQDQRDLAVDSLSKLVSVQVKEQTDGTYSVSLLQKEGAPVLLVSGTETVSTLTTDSEPANGKLTGLAQSIATVEKYHSQLHETVKGFAEANGMSAENGSAGTNLFAGNQADFTIAGLTVNEDSGQYALPTDTDTATEKVKSGYQTLVSELGAETQAAGRFVSSFDATLNATENRRQSVTGVSLDEEMANLVKYQHAYSAAARIVSTADEMLDTLINRMAR